jgi:hypothetical protein
MNHDLKRQVSTYAGTPLMRQAETYGLTAAPNKNSVR